MATRESDIKGMFERMDHNEFAAPSSPKPAKQTFKVGDGVSVSITPPAGMSVEMSTEDNSGFWPKRRTIQPEQPDDFDSFFQKMDAGHPDEMSSMFDRMDKTTSVKFNEDVDFSDETGPIKDYKPLGFTPSDTISEMSTLQRVGEGFRQLGSNDRPIRSTSPNLIGKSLELALPDSGRRPTRDEVTAAYFNALGPQAVEVNRRFRNQVGRDIEVPAVSDEDLTMGYDPKAKVYKVKVAPTQAALRAIDAYGQGGLEAAQNVLAEMQSKDDEAAMKEAQEREAAKNIARRMGFDPDKAEGNPIARGLSRAGLGATRAINNLSATVRNPADAARDAQFINEAAASIPRSKSAVGRVVEDVTAAGASMPLYMSAGPLGAGLVGYTQNLDQGTEAAAKEGLKMGVAGGVAQGVGQATEGMSPLARQVVSRKAAGLTNVALDKLSGSDNSVFESFVTGAALPVGKRGAEKVGPETSVSRLTGERPGFLGEVNAAVNLPRGLQASFDDSAILRQNLILGITNPREAFNSFGQSIRALTSQGKTDAILDQLHSDPAVVQKRQDAGLYLASQNRGENTPFLNREEPFSSKWAQKVPGVKQSERAYTVATDTLRAGVFDKYVEAHPDASPETLKGVARFINYASGRGDLIGVRGVDKTLAQVFYSPRLAVSRPQLLTTAIKNVTPEATAYARAQLTKYFAATAGFLGMARMAGAQVSFDPTSPDFAKLKIGNTRIDLGAGYAQLFRYMSQAVTGRGRSLKSGGEYEAGRGAVIERFFRTKLSPQAGIIVNLVTGKDLQGQPTSLRNEVGKLAVPLSFGDVYETWKDAGAKGAAMGSLSLFGAGIQTIKPQTQGERINEMVERMKSEPESKGLDENQLKHNARVSLEVNRLLDSVPEAKREDARKALNQWLYYGRVRPGDRRSMESINRVLNEKLQTAETLLKRRGLLR